MRVRMRFVGRDSFSSISARGDGRLCVSIDASSAMGIHAMATPLCDDASSLVETAARGGITCNGGANSSPPEMPSSPHAYVRIEWAATRPRECDTTRQRSHSTPRTSMMKASNTLECLDITNRRARDRCILEE